MKHTTNQRMPLATATSFTRAFIPAWLVTYILASVSHTQMVLLSLAELGVSIDLSTLASSTLHDIVGLLPIYGSLIAAALFVSLSVTGFMTARFSARRVLVPVATGVAMLVMLLLMAHLLQFHLIAGTRSVLGLALQIIAGACGGALFLRIFRPTVYR